MRDKILDFLITATSLVSNILTIIASTIAIFLFWTQRKKISTAFDLLLNYSHQLTLSELKEKLERLNDCNPNTKKGKEQIVNIFHEILGQIRGNKSLKEELSDIVGKIEGFCADENNLTKPRRNALVNEIRERIRNLNVKNAAMHIILPISKVTTQLKVLRNTKILILMNSEQWFTGATISMVGK